MTAGGFIVSYEAARATSATATNTFPMELQGLGRYYAAQGLGR